jgi:hypothetical protein
MTVTYLACWCEKSSTVGFRYPDYLPLILNDWGARKLADR